MNTRPVNFHRILALFILATVLCGLGLSFAGSESNGGGDHFSAGKTGERHLRPGDLASTDAAAGSSTPTATPTPTPFSHPLLFPPVAAEANVSIGIDGVRADIGWAMH